MRSYMILYKISMHSLCSNLKRLYLTSCGLGHLAQGLGK